MESVNGGQGLENFRRSSVVLVVRQVGPSRSLTGLQHLVLYDFGRRPVHGLQEESEDGASFWVFEASLDLTW